LRLERQQKLLLSKRKKKSISTVPHCKIQQRIIRRITPTALVVGTEATGLTQEWRDAATKTL
jgi:tRNA G18 (ribose-2'-O)-methylase SpoU